MENILKERDSEKEKGTGIRFLDVVSPINATKEVLREEFENGRILSLWSANVLIEEALYEHYKLGDIILDEEQCGKIKNKIMEQLAKYKKLIGKDDV